MIRQLAVLLTAALLLVACQGGDDAGGNRAAGSHASPADAPEGVTVTGQGRAPGQPDTLQVTVGVEVSRPGVAEAFDDAAAAADRVLAAIREQGVEEEDIRTRDFSVHPEREPPRPPDEPVGPEGHPPVPPHGPPEVSGYLVRNVVEVTVDDVDQAGQLLTAVTEAGGDDIRVQGLRFVLEDEDDLLEAAREDAFADARSKAEHYAELAGAELGELVSVADLSGPSPPPPPALGTAPLEGLEPPVLPGEQEIGVQVRATWALE